MAIKICFYKFGLDRPTINAWFGGMWYSFFEALEELGCQVCYTKDKPEMSADVLVVPMGDKQDQSSAQAMNRFGGPTILIPGPASGWFRHAFLERWREQVLFAYGEDISENSPKMYGQFGIPYYHIPYASNPKIMRPLNLPKLYDVIFVANALSGVGRYKYIDILMKEAGKKRILLFGHHWEKYGFPNQSIAWGDLLNLIYNLGEICINLHTDRQKENPKKRLDANSRLFDLAMAGCFQICDAPEIVRHYFNENEVVAVESSAEWVEKIMYYIDNPKETESFRIAAKKRALKEHTWKNRAEVFLKAIEVHLPLWKEATRSPSYQKRLFRLRDTNLPPYGFRESVNKIKKRVHRKLDRLM